MSESPLDELSVADRALARRAGALLREASAPPPLRERYVVERVLAATVREDLSWRGELRLVARHVHTSLRSSVALRVLAASLLLHLLGLPVVAMLVFFERAPEPGLSITVDRPGELPFEEQVEALPPVEDPFPTDGLEFGPSPDALENATRRARWVRSTRRFDDATTGADPCTEMRLLLARTGGFEDGAPRLAAELETLATAGPLARVLAAELAIDLFVAGGERHASLGRLVGALAVRPEGEHAAVTRLRRAALERAQAYGLWDAPVGFDPLAAPLPFDDAWRRDLVSAWAAEGLPGAGQVEALVRR